MFNIFFSVNSFMFVIAVMQNIVYSILFIRFNLHTFLCTLKIRFCFRKRIFYVTSNTI